MWQKNKLDNFNQNGFKRIAILIKRINIILNKKSKRKYLDLSYTNADS
jgi:hypothetical protein